MVTKEENLYDTEIQLPSLITVTRMFALESTIV